MTDRRPACMFFQVLGLQAQIAPTKKTRVVRCPICQQTGHYAKTCPTKGKGAKALGKKKAAAEVGGPTATIRGEHDSAIVGGNSGPDGDRDEMVGFIPQGGRISRDNVHLLVTGLDIYGWLPFIFRNAHWMDYIAFATAAPVAMTKKKSLMWAIKSLLSQLATTFKAMCYHHDQFDDQCVLFRRRRLYRCYNPQFSLWGIIQLCPSLLCPI